MNQSFNGLTHAEAERLACLAEEAGEVVQAVTKILRHGWDYPGRPNRQDLEREIGDFKAVVAQLADAGDVSRRRIKEAMDRKIGSRHLYQHHQFPVLSTRGPCTAHDAFSTACLEDGDQYLGPETK